MTGGDPLNAEELGLIQAYWRAANYVSVGQDIEVAREVRRVLSTNQGK